MLVINIENLLRDIKEWHMLLVGKLKRDFSLNTTQTLIGVNLLQYRDGRRILKINWRLLARHNGSPQTPQNTSNTKLRSFDHLYRLCKLISIITSYNYSSTQNTQEVCVGVVKANGVFPKDAAQHAGFSLFTILPYLSPVFTNPTDNLPKLIQCIRVDGCNDEGPSHAWGSPILLDCQTPTVITFTTWSPNRVELQNGCICHLLMLSYLFLQFLQYPLKQEGWFCQISETTCNLQQKCT